MEKISAIIILAIIAAICVGVLVWLEIKQAARDITIYSLRVKSWGEEQARKAYEDERDHRRMVYEADSYNEACNGMEPFCSEGKKP